MVRSDGLQPTSFAVEPQELEDLKLDAKAEGMSVSQYLRRIIRNRSSGATPVNHKARPETEKREITQEDAGTPEYNKEKEAFKAAYTETLDEERKLNKMLELMGKMNEEHEGLKKQIQSMQHDINILDKNCDVLSQHLRR